jgi:hypothetical protein
MPFKRSAVSAALFAVLSIPCSLGAATITYTASLSGANEVPPVTTPATGFITVVLNGDLLTVNESYSGMLSPVNGAHIHCCGPLGTNQAIAVPFTNFPTTTSGTYAMTFDLTLPATYTTAFLGSSGGTATGAETALIAGLNSFQAYANIHDTVNPGGEIRGQLAAIPEPSAEFLAGIGLISLVLLRRRAVAHHER